MDFLLFLDRQVFFFINHLPHTSWADFIAEAFSGFGYAWIIWFVIAVILFIRKETKDHRFWIPLGIAAMLCYVLSEVFFKNITMRARPDLLITTLVIGDIPRSFSFPSTHATVAFAYAYIFSRKELHWIWLYILAGLVCFSRIYLGHHYPIDVIGGMMLGTVIGMCSLKLEDHVYKTKHVAGNYPSKRKAK